jgi:hypothetical protein
MTPDHFLLDAAGYFLVLQFPTQSTRLASRDRA